MEKWKNRNIILPHDFVQFIRRNYERIEEIERKVEQFENDPWNKYSANFRNFRGFQFHKLFDSVDSCFSDADERKVISASIQPKFANLDAAEDRIQVGPEYLDNLNEAVESESDEYDNLIKKFPLITISKTTKGSKSKGVFPSSPLLVQGVPLTFSERQQQINQMHKKESRRFQGKEVKARSKKKRVTLSRQELIKSLRIKVPLGESWTSGESTVELEDEIEDVERSNTNANNKLQLTLPPLHSSVLTLLGQRSGPKPSPRNLLSLAQEPSISSGASRHKKLRRHGRNRTKNAKEKGDDLKPGDRAGSEEVKKTTTDEPQETQVSTFPDNDEQSSIIDGRLERDANFDDTADKLQKLTESRRSLYHVLDDHLAGKPWNAQDMANLDEEIRTLSDEFGKYQTKFKSNLIKMKEDHWLSFPRTWSRSSATFGVPYDTRRLKVMTSLYYLEKFVTISEPRKHLYSLIFQRHRMISNPTGKHITLKTCQTALTEVLGKPFLEDEMKELCEKYLGCLDNNLPILEHTFHGISAFCERIYSCYSLEEHHECHICHNNPNKDKKRCHRDQKSHIEKADLAYLSSKIKQGEVEPHLSNLLMALCNRD